MSQQLSDKQKIMIRKAMDIALRKFTKELLNRRIQPDQFEAFASVESSKIAEAIITMIGQESDLSGAVAALSMPPPTEKKQAYSMLDILNMDGD